MKTYDAIIIGFGKGGKTLAVELAKREWTVAVVERSEKMYGGTCINTGCIPTKTLIHQAKAAAMRLELPFDRKKEFYRRAVAVKEEVVSSLRDRNYHNLADRPGITVYTGVGSFVSPDEVSVEGAEGRQVLKAKYIFIDTGAETVLPPIDGLSASRFLHTSASIMEMKELPRRLAIVGGGYIGLEFASMYASFGSEVTVFEGGPVLMPREDRDVADSVRETLEKKGIVFRTGADVLSVRDSGGAAKVSWRQAGEGRVGELEADAVLIAAGRRPATEGLNLEAAGVKVDSRGAVIVDDRLRTSNPNIRAIGDVKGGTPVHLHFAGRLPDYPGRPVRRGGAENRRPQSGGLLRIHRPAVVAHRHYRRDGPAEQPGCPGQPDSRRFDSPDADHRRDGRPVESGDRRPHEPDSGMYAVLSRIERGHQYGRRGDEIRTHCRFSSRFRFHAPERQRSAERPVRLKSAGRFGLPAGSESDNRNVFRCEAAVRRRSLPFSYGPVFRPDLRSRMPFAAGCANRGISEHSIGKMFVYYRSDVYFYDD